MKLTRIAEKIRIKPTIGILLVAFCGMLCLPSKVLAFTQHSSEAIPIGHEWVTRVAFYELLKPHGIRDPQWKNTWNNDPRKSWSNNRKAQNTDLGNATGTIQRIVHNDQYRRSFLNKRLKDETLYETFGVDHRVVFSTIMGVRWVDLSGYNVAIEMESGLDCWSAVNQDANGVQTHHFLREWNESGPEGGIKAIKRGHDDFKRFFVEAVMAYGKQGEFDLTTIMDGGLWRAKTNVLLPYFLLGRALHLFQDSFSLEHAIRSQDDDFRSIREVKSYCCTPGSEQHKHDNASIILYTNHDVIWKKSLLADNPLWWKNWRNYKPANLKELPLVAIEGTKDVWAAFFRAAMGNGNNDAQMRAAAEREADKLIQNWLSYSDEGVRNWYKDPNHRDGTYVAPDGTGSSHCFEVAKITTSTLSKHIDKLKSEQCKCLYNTMPVLGYEDAYDDHLMLPLVWRYIGSTYPYSVAPVAMIDPPNNFDPKVAMYQVQKRVRNIDISYEGKTLCIPKNANLEKLSKITDIGNYLANEAPVTWRHPGNRFVKLDLEIVGENDNFYIRVKNDPRFFLVPTSGALAFGTVILWPDSEGITYYLSKPETHGGKWAIKSKSFPPDEQHFKREAGDGESKAVYVEKEQPDSWNNYKWDVTIRNR